MLNAIQEIGERLQTIQQKHALVTLVKIEEQRRRNVDLTQRLIRASISMKRQKIDADAFL